MKLLDLSQELKTMDGKPFIADEKTKEPMTLRHVLLTYVANANGMGVKENERGILYDAGLKIGAEHGTVTLSQGEYDAIKRLSDDGTIKGQRGAEYVFSFPISEQVKKMVNAAENAKKEDGVK